MSLETLPAVVQAGHPRLRASAAPVPEQMFGSAELKALVRTMTAVMRGAPGVGLAAPQIGVGLRVAVIEDPPELTARLSAAQRAARGRTPTPLTVLVNPTVRCIGEARATFFEGCLSVTGYVALVERHLQVEVDAVDVEGATVQFVAKGWPARIAQHEVDHLDGALYVDRMISRSFCANREVATRWMDLPIDEVRAALGA